ncbi:MULTISPECIES: AAA family ATPase [Alphaproteobacteria]|uniref:ATPase n=2 Tax=Alphaproteobacteria TaxID=28211 RepID=A0A512HQ01_9HYPH|nr:MULTISPECIES: AAA family ATPase [Alphaproteobacteria]GEO87521.1 ATPase [Ciceribacter naphthalenivorans]GLR21640.1 ATPase [Ciceribacter naphthalenivorans]GLT04496.1 ATPase [Sphingomonas psychrolutea]
MSYKTIIRPKSPPPLAIAVARCGARHALRPFLRRENLAFIAVLIAPEDTADYYRRAVSGLIQDPAHVDEYGNDTAAVFTVTESTIDPRTVYDRIKFARQVVVVTEKREYLPADFLAGADLVKDVGRPTPEHFVAAAREAKMPGMTREHAEFLSTKSLDAILVSVRQTRPLMSSVRQMKRIAARPVEPKPTASKEKSPSVRLEEMHGYGKAKDWGLQLAEDLSAWRAGEIKWEDVDRGALLYGPPGCGKTSYAKALAATCNVALVTASAAKWQARGHLGDYLKAMRAVFEEAKKRAPSLLFIDEFDSFGDRESPTSDDHHRDYRRQVINGLLECLDPSEGRDGVVVIGAANNPDGIDPALLRSGRLETMIEIPLPDAAARLGILHQHLRGQRIEGDLRKVVAATRSWSGADIEKLARDVRRLARRRHTAITDSLLLEVMPKRYVLTTSELRHAAVHEAGHAIVGVLLGRDVLIGVHIERDVPVGGARQSAGRASFEPVSGIFGTSAHYDDRIAVLLGGIAAETVMLGFHGDGAGGAPASDLALATDLATRAERHYGLGATLSVELGHGSHPLESIRRRDPELRRLVESRLRKQFERAVGILSEKRTDLDLLVDRLVTRGHVTGDEVRAMLLKGSGDTASVAP